MLAAAINSKDIAETKRISHLMQTTVRAVNERSLLYDYLVRIENAENSIKGWQMIHENFAVLSNHELRIIQQAKEILAATNKTDRQIKV